MLIRWGGNESSKTHMRGKEGETGENRLYSSSLLQNPDDTLQYSQAARLAISVSEDCGFQLYGREKCGKIFKGHFETK